VKQAPRSPEAHNSLGWVLTADGQTAEAIAHLETALRLKPDFLEAHINLASAFAQGRDLAEAESEARAATKLAPAVRRRTVPLDGCLVFAGT